MLPQKRGRKVKDLLGIEEDLIEKIKNLRKESYNRYDISEKLQKENEIEISDSKVYRLLRRLGINQLNPRIKEEKKKIVKEHAIEEELLRFVGAEPKYPKRILHQTFSSNLSAACRASFVMLAPESILAISSRRCSLVKSVTTE